MADINKIKRAISEYEKKFSITEQSSDAEKLRAKLIKKGLSKDDCLRLEEEVIAFLKSDASEKDKEMIISYTESLSMICSAIREGLI